MLQRSSSWDGTESGSSLAWLAGNNVKNNNWMSNSPGAARKFQGSKGLQGQYNDFAGDQGLSKGRKGLDWMDIANNPASGKPPKVPQGALLYALKVTLLTIFSTRGQQLLLSSPNVHYSYHTCNHAFVYVLVFSASSVVKIADVL